MSPDGEYIVYRGESEELYASRTQRPSRPYALGVGSGHEDRHRVSPDGTHVVTTSDGELWSVLLDGSAPPVRLFDTQDEFTSPVFRFAPDGEGIVLAASGGLWSVDIDGGPVLFLNEAQQGIPGALRTPTLSADGAWVVYRIDDFSMPSLHAVPVDGSQAPLDLHPPLGPGQGVQGFALTPDSNHVVFLGDLLVAGRQDLFRVPIDGTSAPVLLSPPLVAGGNVLDFVLEESGTDIVYRADQLVDQVFELFRIPLAGGSATKLSGDLVAGGVVQEDYEIAGSRILFRAGAFNPGVIELFSALLDGSSDPVRLSGSMVAGGDVRSGFAATSDGLTVVYRADQEVDERIEAYRVPIDGGVPAVKLNAPITGGVDVRSVLLDPTESQVLYLAWRDLFAVALDGTSPPSLLHPPGDVEFLPLLHPEEARLFYLFEPASEPMLVVEGSLDGSVYREMSTVQAGAVSDALLTPRGERVVYTGSFEADGGIGVGLFSAETDGSRAPRRLTPSSSLTPAVDVTISPDGSWVAYRLEGAGFLVPIDRSVEPIEFTEGLLSPQETLLEFSFSVDSQHVVFRVEGPSEVRLYSVAVDGGSPPIELSAPPGAGAGVLRFYAQEVVGSVLYLADVTTAGIHELYVVPVDGGASLRLFGGPGVAERVLDAAMSPDGFRAVFRVAGAARNLYSVPLDAALPPVPLTSFGSQGVERYEIDPQSASVVFTARDSLVFPYELFAVPSNGSAAPSSLSGLPAFGSIGVQDFGFDTSGQTLFFRASYALNGPEELYSVPRDGGAPPVRVSHDLEPDEDVNAIHLVPGSSRVVYEATRAGLPERFYSLPADGSSPAVPLHAQLPAGREILSFDASREEFVYVADEVTGGVFELFHVPLEGGAVRRRGGPRVPGGDVEDVLITPDGNRAVYLADEQVDGLVELFGAYLTIPHQRSPLRGGLPLR